MKLRADDWLPLVEVTAELAPRSRHWLHCAERYACIESTQRALLAAPSVDRRLLWAARQTAGEGRVHRSWISPDGASLAFSLGIARDQPLALLRGLSVAVGVGLVDALAPFATQPLQLKWPNDLLSGGRKCGGVLVSLRSTVPPVEAVIGVGLNLWPDARFETVEPLPGALREHADPRLAVALMARAVDALIDVLSSDGLQPWLERFDEHDAWRGCELNLRIGGGVIVGRSRGIDRDGALRLRLPDGSERSFDAGECSLRLA